MVVVHGLKQGGCRRRCIAVIAAAFALTAASASAAQTQAKPFPSYCIDGSIPSQNQDSRIRSLVFHYTAEDLPDSLAHLTEAKYQTSAHYLIPQEPQAWHVYSLVPERERAWHAGVSQWQGVNNLNFSSIGIEIVNLGFPPEDENLPLMERHWYPYDEQQIAVMGRLARSIIDRYRIEPYRVIGHSDISFGRKTDPGPLFPWAYLYSRYGIGAWPDADTVDYFRRAHPYDSDVADLQGKLNRYGYAVPLSGTLDKATGEAVAAFQMHFRPTRYDGVPDIETVAILDALLQKYFSPDRPKAPPVPLPPMPSNCQ